MALIEEKLLNLPFYLEIIKIPDTNLFLIRYFPPPQGEVHDIFSDSCIRDAQIRDYFTRQRQHFHVPSEWKKQQLGNVAFLA